MSTNHERFFKAMLIALTILIVMAVSESRAEQVVNIPVTAKLFTEVREANGRVKITYDLLPAIRRLAPEALKDGGLELYSVRLEAKSGLGGGQVMLQVTSSRGQSFVDSSRVETDPDIFSSAKDFKKIELRNHEAHIQGVVLVGLNSLRIKTLQIVLGPPRQIEISGSYDDLDAPETPVARTQSDPPTPPPNQQRSSSVDANCLGTVCIGNKVTHRRTSWQGEVVSIDLRRQRAIVRFRDSSGWFEAPVQIRNLDLQH